MTPKDLRLMRKKARVSIEALARELGVSGEVVRKIELDDKLWPTSVWADRYVEALTRLTA